MSLETAIAVIEMDAEPDLIGAAAKTVLQELQRLQAKNKSLRALANLGYWALTEQFKEKDETFCYSLEDKAEELGLLKGSYYSGKRSPLAKLPEL